MTNRQQGVLALLGAMISIQSGGSLAKILFRLIGPAGAVTLRVGIAGVALALLCRPRIQKFSRRDWIGVLLYGASIGVMNLFFYFGIRRVPLGIGVAVEFLGPLSVALFSSRQAIDFLWACLAAVGVALIVPWQGGALDLTGLVLVGCAGVMWGSYIVITKRVTATMKNTDVVGCGLCVAMLITLPFGLASGDLFSLNCQILWLGTAVAVTSSLLPFLLDFVALSRLPAKTFGILSSLEPACAALSGWLILGEMLSFRQWLALFFIMAASVGATLAAPEKTA